MMAWKYVDDINAWKSYCAGGGYSYDTMVGPLMDFTFSVNADATIDATFTIGTKNEIPAFLGTTRHDKTMTVGSNKEQSCNFWYFTSLFFLFRFIVECTTSIRKYNILNYKSIYNFFLKKIDLR